MVVIFYGSVSIYCICPNDGIYCVVVSFLYGTVSKACVLVSFWYGIFSTVCWSVFCTVVYW